MIVKCALFVITIYGRIVDASKIFLKYFKMWFYVFKKNKYTNTMENQRNFSIGKPTLQTIYYIQNQQKK